MCITVNSKHNVIRKMFSVIKYLVLVFAFVFVGVCNSEDRASAAITYLQGTTIKKITWQNPIHKSANGYAYIGYDDEYIDVEIGTGYYVDTYITSLTVNVYDYENDKYIGNFDVDVLTNKTSTLYLRLYFDSSKNGGKAYIWMYDTQCFITCWQRDIEENFKLKYEGSTKMTFADYLKKATIKEEGFGFEVKFKTTSIGEKKLQAAFVRNTANVEVTSQSVKLSKGRDIAGVQVTNTVGLDGTNVTKNVMDWCLYDMNAQTCLEEGTEYIESQFATSITITTNVIEKANSNEGYDLYFRLYTPYVDLYQDPPSKSNFEYSNVFTPFEKSELPKISITTDSFNDDSPNTIIIDISDNVAVESAYYYVAPEKDEDAELLLNKCTSFSCNNMKVTTQIPVSEEGIVSDFSFRTPRGVEGKYMVVVLAMDTSGLISKKYIKFFLDTKSPTISVDEVDDWNDYSSGLKLSITDYKWTSTNPPYRKGKTTCYYYFKVRGVQTESQDINCSAYNFTGIVKTVTHIITFENNEDLGLFFDDPNGIELHVYAMDYEGNLPTIVTYTPLKVDNVAPYVSSESVSQQITKQHNSSYTITEPRLDLDNSYLCLVEENNQKCSDDNKILVKYFGSWSNDGRKYVVNVDTESKAFKDKYNGGNDIVLNGNYHVCFVLNEKESKPHGTVYTCGGEMTFDNTKPGIIEATKTKYSMTTDGTLINVANPIIGGFNVMTKMQIMDATSLSEIVTSNGSNNGYIADFENKFYIKVIGIKGNNTIIIDGGYNLLKTTEYKMIKENGKYYLMITIGLCDRAETPTCYSVDSTEYDSLQVKVYIREDIVTDTAGNSLNLPTSSKFGKDPNKYYELTTVELRLGSKNDFTVQTVAKQETNNNNNQNEGQGSTQVTTLSSVVEREEILVEEIREANVKEVVIPLEETNMVIQVDETLVEITVEEVEEKETEKEIVVVVDENTEIVVINYGSMSYEYKVKEITSNLNREVILHELMVSNKRVLVKLKSMKEH